MSHLKHLPVTKTCLSVIAPRFIKKGKEAADFILVLFKLTSEFWRIIAIY